MNISGYASTVSSDMSLSNHPTAMIGSEQKHTLNSMYDVDSNNEVPE